ncbi:MAG: carbon dioxide concentrating mechanism protein CcmL [Planctomycetaceae bacterium]|nr:carbon dioxide concentrating mechanism protein CcmL [Planctomycetaceae bacterium]
MRIADVIGKVTLSRAHRSLSGATWLIAVPLQRSAIVGDSKGRGEPYVVYDELGANKDTRIAVAEGAEAAAPFHPNPKPIDTYNAAILDSIEID